MSKHEDPPRDLVEKLRRLGPEKVVDGHELCPACHGLSPAVGWRTASSGDDEEYIIDCNVCHSRHAVTVEEADCWRNEMRQKHGGISDE
jgi:hypothetical protein